MSETNGGGQIAEELRTLVSEAEALLRRYGDHLNPGTAAFIQSSLEADLQTRDR